MPLPGPGAPRSSSSTAIAVHVYGLCIPRPLPRLMCRWRPGGALHAAIYNDTQTYVNKRPSPGRHLGLSRGHAENRVTADHRITRRIRGCEQIVRGGERTHVHVHVHVYASMHACMGE